MNIPKMLDSLGLHFTDTYSFSKMAGLSKNKAPSKRALIPASPAEILSESSNAEIEIQESANLLEPNLPETFDANG